MYIVEFFIKWLNKNKRGTGANPENHFKERTGFPEETASNSVEDEALTCEHNFMPVDSTGLVLACTKCGFVIKHK